jgi:hypothetical protein
MWALLEILKVLLQWENRKTVVTLQNNFNGMLLTIQAALI